MESVLSVIILYSARETVQSRGGRVVVVQSFEDSAVTMTNDHTR